MSGRMVTVRTFLADGRSPRFPDRSRARAPPAEPDHSCCGRSLGLSAAARSRRSRPAPGKRRAGLARPPPVEPDHSCCGRSLGLSAAARSRRFARPRVSGARAWRDRHRLDVDRPLLARHHPLGSLIAFANAVVDQLVRSGVAGLPRRHHLGRSGVCLDHRRRRCMHARSDKGPITIGGRAAEHRQREDGDDRGKASAAALLLLMGWKSASSRASPSA